MPESIDEYFTATISAMSGPARRLTDDQPIVDGSSLTARVCLALFDVQLGSRHLDLAARWLRSQGRGYYTIGSSGHEGNAAVAAALRPTDPALLHYRSGAFFLARAALSRSHGVPCSAFSAAEYPSAASVQRPRCSSSRAA